MPLPSPQSLAQAIARTSFSLEEKQQMIAALPKLTERQITELYELLLALYDEETKLIKSVKLIDLKYQTKVQLLIDEAKKNFG
jgi:hypothetical protein